MSAPSAPKALSLPAPSRGTRFQAGLPVTALGASGEERRILRWAEGGLGAPYLLA